MRTYLYVRLYISIQIYVEGLGFRVGPQLRTVCGATAIIRQNGDGRRKIREGRGGMRSRRAGTFSKTLEDKKQVEPPRISEENKRKRERKRRKEKRGVTGTQVTMKRRVKEQKRDDNSSETEEQKKKRKAGARCTGEQKKERRYLWEGSRTTAS